MLSFFYSEKMLYPNNLKMQVANTAATSSRTGIVLWHFKKSDATVIYSAKTNYLLKPISKGYKIASVIMVNEYTEFSKIIGKKL